MKRLLSRRSRLLSKIRCNPVRRLDVVARFELFVAFVSFTKVKDIFYSTSFPCCMAVFLPVLLHRWTWDESLCEQRYRQKPGSPSVHPSVGVWLMHGAQHGPGDGSRAPNTSHARVWAG